MSLRLLKSMHLRYVDRPLANLLKSSDVSQFYPWPPAAVSSPTEKPFHIYDDEFYDVIGDDPTLTLIASSEKDPLFHEAVVWCGWQRAPSHDKSADILPC